MRDKLSSLIKFVCKQLNIYDDSSLRFHWEDALDLFFYFNKTTGCGVPSYDDVRRCLYGPERNY